MTLFFIKNAGRNWHGQKLLSLLTGIQAFERLRGMRKLYVDKTERLARLGEDAEGFAFRVGSSSGGQERFQG